MDEPEFCAGCLRDNEETKAVAWCSNCSEWVCKPCGRVHARFAIPHKVVPTKEAKKLSSSVLQLSKNCAIHSDQRIILFCIPTGTAYPSTAHEITPGGTHVAQSLVLYAVLCGLSCY